MESPFTSSDQSQYGLTLDGLLRLYRDSEDKANSTRGYLQIVDLLVLMIIAHHPSLTQVEIHKHIFKYNTAYKQRLKSPLRRLFNLGYICKATPIKDTPRFYITKAGSHYLTQSIGATR